MQNISSKKQRQTDNKLRFMSKAKLHIGIFIVVTLIGCNTKAFGAQSTDTCTTTKHYNLKQGNSLTFGIPLIAASVAVHQFDKDYRALRYSHIGNYSNHTDNYLQYSPYVVLLGMKAAGVESRYTWERTIGYHATSVAFLIGLTQIPKYTISRDRPDGSTNNSFPSGHTATAFMGATLLHHEYGYISPWISIGGYTVASVTGLMRVANNRHWASDVIAGAGIGIISAELGLVLSDLLFKNRGLNPNFRQTYKTQFEPNSPSFIGFHMGPVLSRVKYVNKKSVEKDVACGIEGAWFCNNYIGIGAQFEIGSITFTLKNDSIDYKFSTTNTSTGIYFNLPLSRLFSISSKALLCYTNYGCATQNDGKETERCGGFGLGSGIGLNYNIRHNVGYMLNCNYNLKPTHKQSAAKRNVNSLSFAAGICARF